MIKSIKAVFASTILLFGVNNAMAASPSAGVIIGNQATASYTDGSGTVKTSTSNLVETSIEQVGGVLVQDNQNKSVPVGGTVYFQHTVINTGNGNDTFNLSVVDNNTGSISFTNLKIYPDADQNGVPDNSSEITVTPNLSRGESFGVVIAATVSSSVVSGETETIKLEATSNFDNLESDIDIDTITITNNAVINVTKSFSRSSGESPSLTPITVTFTYTNIGDKSASGFNIVDNLPSGMNYVPNSAVWTGLSNTTLTDADDGFEGSGLISYSSLNNVINATITNIAPGDSGQLRFDVTIGSNVAPGNLNNIGIISYEDGNGGNVGPENTNTATYNVLQTANVVLTDNGSSTDEDGVVNDKVTKLAPVSQGSSVIFENIVVNNGNGSDVFELQVDQHNFPSGTIFQFLKADGVTALTDTNGNSNPDTSLISAGGVFKFKIRAILPSNAYGNNNGNGYSVFVKGTSIFDSSKTDTVEDVLVSISQSTVDITNNVSVNNGATSNEGLGSGPEGLPVVTVSTLPNSVVEFDLYINNTSGNSEVYTLQASTDPTFNNVSLPAGWNVVFKNTTGNSVSNTGSVASNASANIKAEISVPSNQSHGQISVYFRASSSLSGAKDVIHDAINVLPVVDLSITPNNNGQVFAGGTVTYVHTITNTGNKSPELTGDILVTNSEGGWSSVVYWDQNGNSVIDSGEPVINAISDMGGLLAGESKQIIVKVFSPAGLNDGDNNTTTITIANVTGELNTNNNIVTNSSVIISGDIVLTKYQSIDSDCNGTEDSSFIQGAQFAKPGECIVYKVVATNTGTASVSNLEVNDATPPYTTYFDCAGACPVNTSGVVSTVPVSGNDGLITVTTPVLNPLSNIEIKFVVKIDE